MPLTDKKYKFKELEELRTEIILNYEWIKMLKDAILELQKEVKAIKEKLKLNE